MIRNRGRILSAGFRVGDRVHHRDFGEGLIVEVRERDGFEVLEIAFPDGIRRLTSLYPLESARPAGKARAPSAVATTPSAVPHPGGLAVPARSQFRIASGSEEVYRRLQTGPFDAPRDTDLRPRIE